jgi:hypothetical protein
LTRFTTVPRILSARFVAAVVSIILSARFATLSTRLVFAGLFYAFVFLNKRVNTTLFFG